MNKRLRGVIADRRLDLPVIQDQNTGIEKPAMPLSLMERVAEWLYSPPEEVHRIKPANVPTYTKGKYKDLDQIRPPDQLLYFDGQETAEQRKRISRVIGEIEFLRSYSGSIQFDDEDDPISESFCFAADSHQGENYKELKMQKRRCLNLLCLSLIAAVTLLSQDFTYEKTPPLSGILTHHPTISVARIDFLPDNSGVKPYWRTQQMVHHAAGFGSPIPDPHERLQRFKTLRNDPELIELEAVLRQLNLWDNPTIQNKHRLARLGTETTRHRMRIEMRQIIENYRIQAMRLGDPHMPYATAEQISKNNQGIHILNQAHNGVPMYVEPYSYCLLWLVLGPQGSGKSSATFYHLRQMHVPILILDPKGTWEFRANQLQAKVIPPDCIRLDCDFKEDLLRNYLHSIADGIAFCTGLQYGLSCLYEALDIAVAQRQRYIEQTGERTGLCLKDISLALQLCDTKKAKRAQYAEVARTALDLLVWPNKLFVTRAGLPLDELFKGRYILPCWHLSTVQCRFLAWFLLNRLYFKSLQVPETTQLKSLLVIDDASKFINRPDNVFGSGTKTSAYMHLLSVLRSTGRGVVFIDQLVEPICDDVKQLCNNWLVVGGMRGTHNQSEVASAMGLSAEQSDMLGRLQCREAVCFCPTTYPKAIHGIIPEVPDLLRGNSK